MRKVLLCVSMVAALGLVVGLAIAADELQKAEGVVKSAGGGSVVVTVGGKDLTFGLDDKTKVTQGDKACALADIKPGLKVGVGYLTTQTGLIARTIVIVPVKMGGG